MWFSLFDMCASVGTCEEAKLKTEIAQQNLKFSFSLEILQIGQEIQGNL